MNARQQDEAIVETAVATIAPMGPENRHTTWQSLRISLAICVATARSYFVRRSAYLVDIIRSPMYPAFYFLTLVLTYRVAGRTVVDGFETQGYLLVGTVGVVLWQSNLWASGYAIEQERYEGTINSLFLTPASRAAVVSGYALGSFFFTILPNIAVVAAIAFLMHLHSNVQNPLAVIASVVGLGAATYALGFALAGVFVLSRRANLLANFLQSPIYLLSGMIVPISALPYALRLLADVFPLSAGMTALRESLLAGAGMSDVAGDLTRLIALSAVLMVVGLYMLGRVEHVAKSGAELDFD
ncbi:MAG TPA: ABC transporter permease [Nitrolancea sp.]|nr:ABC transporter permease [Nitrolancea sp.]